MRTGALPVSASPETGEHTSPLPIAGSFLLSILVALVSLAGIRLPSTYARETPNWAAQAIGQDWVDLVLAVPWQIISGVFALRGSRRALLVLAGGLLFVLYEFVIYAFSLQFNRLFLLYCATLGVSFFTLIGVGVRLFRDEMRSSARRPPQRLAGTFLIAVAVIFSALWLADIVPALVQGTAPKSIAEAGTATNPVYVMDLSIVLPLHFIGGVALVRGRPLGYLLGPVLLGFGALMALSIAGMMLVMRARGIEASLGVAAAMALVACASAAVLVQFLRRTADV